MTTTTKIAHISDLHLGRSAKQLAASLAIRQAIDTAAIDHVIVTGDLTEHGLASEFNLFNSLFGSLIVAGRLTIVPGNHDHLGDEISEQIMSGKAVDVTQHDHLYIVRINSTCPHNRSRLRGHGQIDEQIIAEADRLVQLAPAGDLVVVALHHHLLPQPEDLLIEKISSWLGLPFAAELRLGRTLIERLRGRCDLILHGHRHSPRETIFLNPERDLKIYSAGSSTMLGRFRIFTSQAGSRLTSPSWLSATTTR